MMLLSGGKWGFLRLTCIAPGSVLCSSLSFPLTTVLKRMCHRLYFVDEKTEAQRDEVTCLRSYGQEMTELGLESRTLKRAGTFREAYA